MNILYRFMEWIMGKIYPNIPLPMPSLDNNPQVPVVVAPPAPKPPFPPKILLWANLVTQGEGANPILCNPGNLKFSSLTASWGATRGRQASDGGWLCQFPTLEAGHTALCNFLLLAAEGQLIISHPRPCTLEQFTVRYAGNPPQGYIDRIAKGLNVPISVDIATFLA